MVVFPFPQFRKYARYLKGLPEYKPGGSIVGRFPNREIYTRIKTGVKGRDCLILGSITPPDEQLISLLFLAHTLKKEDASKITAFLPYLAYARQDKEKKGESLATSTVGELLRASHIDDVVTLDVHSEKVESLFPIPIHSLSPAKIFAREIRKLRLKNPTFIAPDEGAIERCRAVAREFNTGTDIAYMRKTRGIKSVRSIFYGQVGPNAIVVDDILDTGSTLLECCRILKDRGVRNIYIFVTHGLFTGKAWQRLFKLDVKRIYCSDSIPEVKDLNFKNLVILPIRTLLKEYARHVKDYSQKAKLLVRKADKGEEFFKEEYI